MCKVKHKGEGITKIRTHARQGSSTSSLPLGFDLLFLQKLDKNQCTGAN
jgi:hypothetical protein